MDGRREGGILGSQSVGGKEDGVGEDGGRMDGF